MTLIITETLLFLWYFKCYCYENSSFIFWNNVINSLKIGTSNLYDYLFYFIISVQSTILMFDFFVKNLIKRDNE